MPRFHDGLLRAYSGTSADHDGCAQAVPEGLEDAFGADADFGPQLAANKLLPLHRGENCAQVRPSVPDRLGKISPHGEETSNLSR